MEEERRHPRWQSGRGVLFSIPGGNSLAEAATMSWPLDTRAPPDEAVPTPETASQTSSVAMKSPSTPAVSETSSIYIDVCGI